MSGAAGRPTHPAAACRTAGERGDLPQGDGCDGLLPAALLLCELLGCEAAILKERSPSCGKGEIYDGTFTGALTAGDGVTAELLAVRGIPVYGESRIAELLA